jgi:hypothetical protein
MDVDGADALTPLLAAVERVECKLANPRIAKEEDSNGQINV